MGVGLNIDEAIHYNSNRNLPVYEKEPISIASSRYK